MEGDIPKEMKMKMKSNRIAGQMKTHKLVVWRWFVRCFICPTECRVESSTPSPFPFPSPLYIDSPISNSILNPFSTNAVRRRLYKMNGNWMPQPLRVASGRVAAAIEEMPARDEHVTRHDTKSTSKFRNTTQKSTCKLFMFLELVLHFIYYINYIPLKRL